VEGVVHALNASNPVAWLTYLHFLYCLLNNKTSQQHKSTTKQVNKTSQHHSVLFEHLPVVLLICLVDAYPHVVIERIHSIELCFNDHLSIHQRKLYQVRAGRSDGSTSNIHIGLLWKEAEFPFTGLGASKFKSVVHSIRKPVEGTILAVVLFSLGVETNPSIWILVSGLLLELDRKSVGVVIPRGL